MRISRDEMFSQIVQVVAKRSTCLRSQVGALIVKDGRIISMGYNGPVSGMSECSRKPPHWDTIMEFSRDDTLGFELREQRSKLASTFCEGPGCTRSLHAETNAIAFAARAGVSVEGCTMYCSMSPCINCAKVIVNSGIKEVKFLEKYRNEDGIELLQKSGITVEYLKGGA